MRARMCDTCVACLHAAGREYITLTGYSVVKELVARYLAISVVLALKCLGIADAQQQIPVLLGEKRPNTHTQC